MRPPSGVVHATDALRVNSGGSDFGMADELNGDLFEYRMLNGALHTQAAQPARLSRGRRPWRRSRSAGDAAAVTSCCVDVTESRLGARLGSRGFVNGANIHISVHWLGLCDGLGDPSCQHCVACLA